MWHVLENFYRLSQPAAAWAREAGEHYAAFREAFLQRSSERAGLYPCPRGCGCAHEVIEHGPGDIVAVCRCERWSCPDLRLTVDDVACWELSWTRLGRGLCRALSLESKPADLGLIKTRQIGAWSASGVPVILTIQPEARLFRQAVLELVSRVRTRFILLSPTSRHLTASCLEMLGRVDAAFFDLQSCVQVMPGGRLEATRRPGDLFNKFQPEPEVADGSVLQRALELAQMLDDEQPGLVTAMTVLTLYCQKGLTISQIARQCEVSRGTIMNRLNLLSRRTGMSPNQLRQLSAQLAHIEEKDRATSARFDGEDVEDSGEEE